MEIDAQKYKDFVIFVFAELKELETELLAHKALVHAVNLRHPELELHASLDAMLNSPQVQEQMNRKYDPILERIRERLDLTTLDQVVDELILKWKRTDPVN